MARQDEMTDKQWLTVQLVLPQGEPQGVRTAHITTGNVRAVLVHRNKLAEAAKELNKKVGIYFLFGEIEDHVKRVYIGEANDCLFRLKSHYAKKEFWEKAIAIVSTSEGFTTAHVEYLEWYCIERAKEIGQFALDNECGGTQVAVSEAMRSDLMHYFDTLSILISALGFPLFEPRTKPTDTDVFFLTSIDKLWDGQGQPVEDGFTVFAGSKARKATLPAVPKWVEPTRQMLLDSGTLTETEDGKQLIFKEDYTFKTPSSAAAFLIGGAADGLRQWKSKSGETLGDQLKRASDDSGQCICLPG